MWLCWQVPIYLWPNGSASIYQWITGTRMSESGGETVPMLKRLDLDTSFVGDGI